MNATSALLIGSALLFGGQASTGPLRDKVRISLSMHDQVVYPRAPVRFSVGIHNLTDARMTVGLVLYPAEQKYAQFFYRRVPEEFRPVTYTSEWVAPEPHHPTFTNVVVDAHQQQSIEMSIATDPGRGTFIADAPGTYEIKARYHILWYKPVDFLETQTLRFRVEAAPSSETAALLDWDVDLALFAQNDAGGATSSAPRFRRDVTRALKFIDKHPDSLYSRALRQRTLDTLALLRREGRPLTEYEQDAFERLKRVVREEAQRDAASR